MRSLETRISALEQRRPAPNVVFVASYRHDGSLRPIAKGQVYARQVALMPEVSRTVDEWLKRYVGMSFKDEQAVMERANAALRDRTRGRGGNEMLARTTTR